MKDLNEAAQKAKELFESSKQTVPGNWAKWYHTNIEKALWMKDMDFDISQSEYFKNEFDRQAKEKYVSGDYELTQLNEQGQRINIKICLEKQNIL